MMMVLRLACVLATLASQISADPLAQMSGDWRGTGWAKQTVQGPRESLRCRISNSYDAQSRTLTIKGQCVVPGRKLSMSGTINGTDDSSKLSGKWSNPDGIGSTPIVGRQAGSIIAFNFSATDPVAGNKIAQNVEWRVTQDQLHLRSSDRADPSILMSDVLFNR